MRKLIIQNDSDLSMSCAMALVESVVKQGRISNDGKQFCYLTSFDVDGHEYHVVSDLNKYSDKLTIYKVTKNDTP